PASRSGIPVGARDFECDWSITGPQSVAQSGRMGSPCRNQKPGRPRRISARAFSDEPDDARGASQSDPQFALAYAAIAETYTLEPWSGGLSPREAFPRARDVANHALRLNDG